MAAPPFLFYDLSKVNRTYLIPPQGGNTQYSGVLMTRLKDRNGNYTFDKITSAATRINKGTLFAFNQRNETITLQTQYGTVVATATYPDNGVGPLTTAPFVNFFILNGSGYFKGKTTLKITYNNKLSPKTRTITCS